MERLAAFLYKLSSDFVVDMLRILLICWVSPLQILSVCFLSLTPSLCPLCGRDIVVARAVVYVLCYCLLCMFISFFLFSCCACVCVWVCVCTHMCVCVCVYCCC